MGIKVPALDKEAGKFIDSVVKKYEVTEREAQVAFFTLLYDCVAGGKPAATACGRVVDMCEKLLPTPGGSIGFHKEPAKLVFAAAVLR